MPDEAKWVLPQKQAKTVYVWPSVHEAIVFFAKDKKIRVVEAVDYLLRKALKEEYGLDSEEKTDDEESDDIE